MLAQSDDVGIWQPMARGFSNQEGVEREAIVGEAIWGIHEDHGLTIGHDMFSNLFCHQYKDKVLFVVDVLFIKYCFHCVSFGFPRH